MRAEALSFGVKPILTLTPFNSDGQFSNLLIHNMLSNPLAVDTLVNELYRTVISANYMGVNIDFEYILSEDRILFTQFVREVTDRINELGYEVTVDLAPKTSADQPGLLYEGKDYPALGEAANRSLIMTYEWGYTYGPAMAVAPINKVREVIEYAITEIPNYKIDMGIPNYGYDWTPYFTYVSDGATHEVWFEDARSMRAKYNLVKEYGLHGIGCWQIMRFFRGMWIVAQDEAL